MFEEQKSLPAPEQPPEFCSCRRELLTALFTYGLGILYIEGLFKDRATFFVLFTAAFIAVGFFHFRSRLREREHLIWLSCLLTCLLCSVWGQNRVWGGHTVLFLHAYAIYWILSLSGRLTAGESSGFLPLDALNGVILLPFSCFFTFFRTKVLLWGVKRLRDRREEDVTRALAGGLAALLAMVLLIGAAEMLSRVDANFGKFLSSLLPRVELSLPDLLMTLLLSIPVGAWIFGLIAGAERLPLSRLESRKAGVLRGLARARLVPNGLWIGLACGFVALYLLFFGFQSSYFFGAFSRTLPVKFTVAEYARQGFFELCRVMALNFFLLWLIGCSSTCPVQEHGVSRAVCTVLLAESLLFAFTALSKLLLYIDCFGFTPLRLQSFWLILVLMAGCVLYLLSLWTGKRTAKAWIYFTGISLALLHLY